MYIWYFLCLGKYIYKPWIFLLILFSANISIEVLEKKWSVDIIIMSLDKYRHSACNSDKQSKLFWHLLLSKSGQSLQILFLSLKCWTVFRLNGSKPISVEKGILKIIIQIYCGVTLFKSFLKTNNLKCYLLKHKLVYCKTNVNRMKLKFWNGCMQRNRKWNKNKCFVYTEIAILLICEYIC